MHELDDSVAVGVAMRIVHGADVLAVDMDARAIVERDDREGELRCGRCGTAEGGGAALEALADVLMGDDRSAAREHFVPAGVIAVIVRVDDELDRCP